MAVTSVGHRGCLAEEMSFRLRGLKFGSETIGGLLGWSAPPAMALTELLGIAIGCMLIALGLGSLAAWLLRRRAAERLLLLFGTWCFLYGLRLVAQQPAVHGSMGGSIRTWAYIIALVTYIINVPGALFFEALIGPGWKQSVRRVWQLQAVYAAIAVSTDLITGRPYAAMRPNRPLVLLGLAVLALNVWSYRRRLSRLFTAPATAAGRVRA
jgi:hypothetical protein